MSVERFKLPAAVFMILVRDGKVLLLRRGNTGWCDGDYDLPAGHIDGGESLTIAVQRESLEELGIKIGRDDIEFKTLGHLCWPQDKKEYFNIFFEIKKWEGEPVIAEPHKHDDLQWFDLNKLPTNLTPGTKFGLKAYISKQPFSENFDLIQ
jgi:8-oxo-dGTP pyrophosphatase MutT (NUDIX family)